MNDGSVCLPKSFCVCMRMGGVGLFPPPLILNCIGLFESPSTLALPCSLLFLLVGFLLLFLSLDSVCFLCVFTGCRLMTRCLWVSVLWVSRSLTAACPKLIVGYIQQWGVSAASLRWMRVVSLCVSHKLSLLPSVALTALSFLYCILALMSPAEMLWPCVFVYLSPLFLQKRTIATQLSLPVSPEVSFVRLIWIWCQRVALRLWCSIGFHCWLVLPSCLVRVIWRSPRILCVVVLQHGCLCCFFAK